MARDGDCQLSNEAAADVACLQREQIYFSDELESSWIKLGNCSIPFYDIETIVSSLDHTALSDPGKYDSPSSSFRSALYATFFLHG